MNMSKEIVNQVKYLRNLLLQIRRQSEQAEAIIEPMNALVKELQAIGLLEGTLVLGKCVFSRLYGNLESRNDGKQVYQSAVHVPRGIGVIWWDSEEYVEYRRNPKGDACPSADCFIEFAECEPVIKAALVFEVASLFADLTERVTSGLSLSDIYPNGNELLEN